MDFVWDALFNGTRFRSLTILDTFESLAIEVAQGIKREQVVAVLERLRHQRVIPSAPSGIRTPVSLGGNRP